MSEAGSRACPLTTAFPSARLTSTDSTPALSLSARLTLITQCSQVMPSILSTSVCMVRFHSFQQSQTVEDDQQGHPHVRGNGHPQSGQAGHSQRHEKRLHAQRKPYVLLDNTQRSTRMPYQPGQ